MLHAPMSEPADKHTVRNNKSSSPPRFQELQTSISIHSLGTGSARHLARNAGLRPSQGGLLQRKCACGGTSRLDGECAECRRKQLGSLQRSPVGQAHRSEVRPTDARDFMEPRFGHDFGRIPIYPPAPGAIQAKLTVNTPGDEYEQEADRVAEQVMRMPEPLLHRAYACGGECPKYQTEQPGQEPERLQTKRVQASDTGQIAALPIVREVLAAPGQALDPAGRAFMEPRFGHSFADIRVHADAAAGESARAMGALAYASGTHIVFAPGQYAPGSDHGLQLLAHELTHTVQQSAPGTGHAPLIQRQDAPAGTGRTIDDRANDPTFLMCLALCELGIPPSLWRTVVNDILRAVNQEYRDRLGDMRGSQEFESWRAEFTVMSTFNKLKAVLGFLGESRIGPLTIQNPAAQAIRRAVLTRFAERGVETATLEVASQIIRKVALAIEAAIALGCTTYCGATTIANALLDFSSAALDAITSFVNVTAHLGAALRQAIIRPILVAHASMDPANWNLLALPTRSQAHMQAIGLAFRLAFTPDSFLASMARPLSSYNIPQILVELAEDINATLQSRGGFAQFVTFTADFIGGLTPLQFVDILKDYQLLSFVQDPGVLADQQQAQQAVTPP